MKYVIPMALVPIVLAKSCPLANRLIITKTRNAKATVRLGRIYKHWLTLIKEVREITREWLVIYNNERSHESLSGLPPVQFAKQRQLIQATKGENSIFKQF